MSRNATCRTYKDCIKDILARYENFVVNSPEKAAQVESIARVFSYVIPAGIRGSSLVSELLYSASNLLVLLNDAILRQANGVKLTVPQAKLRGWLAVVECAEVFLELAAEELGGQPMRWLIILCIQLIKAAVRLFLLVRHESGMQCSPLLPPMKRNVSSNTQAKTTMTPPIDSRQPTTFTLQRSKRVIRTLDSAPPMSQRNWKFSTNNNEKPEKPNEECIERPSRLNYQQCLGEVLHITRPLVHLFSMYAFGQTSWKPWLFAGATDITGLALSGDPSQFNMQERAELRRRTLMLLLYFLRSPFYDRVTKTKLLLVLHLMAREIPVFGLAIRPVISYLPIWQKIYAYVWTT